MLTLMNILQGLFLESAMRIAEDEMKEVVVEQISDLFRQGDADDSGTITAQEFEQLLDNDMALPFFLKTLDIRREQAMQLFCLLDKVDSGEIDLHEFVNGIDR